MGRRVEIVGLSGTTYSFLRLEGADTLRTVGVTYLIAEIGAEGCRVFAIGQTNNLAELSWAAPLAQARTRCPSAEVFVRLNINRSLREQEAADLAHLIR